jgi:predicted DNA-binding transcriptional regulator YafY
MSRSRGAKKLTHAARVLRIREMLDGRTALTIGELMSTFGISRRTVYNDLRALEEAGVPLYSEPGPSGEAQWKLQRAARRTTLTLTISQILSLGLARSVLSFLEGTELHDELTTVMERMGHGLSPRMSRYVDQLEQKVAVVHAGAKSYADKVDVLNELLTGLLYDELVELSYRPPGKRVRKHLVEPYTLVVHGEALYLVARSRTRGELRTFAVDRVQGASWLRGQGFDYPADYRPEALTDGSFGLIGAEPTEVEILFDRETAPYIKERTWHPSQTFETTRDRRLRMRMRVGGTIELLQWVLGRAQAAEIVKPDGLREQAREILAAAAARHG